jgi:hypothetical protein
MELVKEWSLNIFGENSDLESLYKHKGFIMKIGPLSLGLFILGPLVVPSPKSLLSLLSKQWKDLSIEDWHCAFFKFIEAWLIEI